jgi:hypothetical protein
MRLSKNQKRMQAISHATDILKAVMCEVRNATLNRQEIVGLRAECQSLECQVKVLKDMIGMAAWSPRDELALRIVLDHVAVEPTKDQGV